MFAKSRLWLSRFTDLQNLANMHFSFDKELDVIYLKFSDAKVFQSDEQRPGIIFDYDVDGNIVGIEILEASQKTETPSDITCEIR